jgi:hypothetical protein
VAEPRHQIAAGDVDVMVIDMGEIGGGPSIEPLGQDTVTLLEKRPIQGTSIQHCIACPLSVHSRASGNPAALKD